MVVNVGGRDRRVITRARTRTPRALIHSLTPAARASFIVCSRTTMLGEQQQSAVDGDSKSLSGGDAVL